MEYLVVGGILGFAIGFLAVCMAVRIAKSNKRKQAKKQIKIHAMDVVLVFMAVFLVAFTVALIWIYYRNGGIPDTLCTCVFAICGGECGIMGMIQNTKTKQKERKYALEDRKYQEKLEQQMQNVNRVDGE